MPPSHDEIGTALDILDQLGCYLRDPAVAGNAQPLLAQVLDEEYGLPMMLGAILRNAAHLVEEHALTPWPVEIRHIIARLRAAAPEVTDCHTLHWDVHRLGGLPFPCVDLAEFRSAVRS
ncbi:hypothetical protein DVK44_27205 [Streptomyces paludis]|uniref:Uncharacterized protein n=1 Tax=Streptomyces paludis TaxID=2282738 RepID=A0A345HVN0_9ACTN|nr:hypothetical protein DVK44_27205 [Streptomyces paludis]